MRLFSIYVFLVLWCGLVFGQANAGTFGAAQFDPTVYYKLGYRTFPQQIVTADFNNDGNPDLAVIDFGGSKISILLGNPDGTFQKPLKFAAPYPIAMAAGDLNGDGNIDLVIIESGGTGDGGVLVYLGDGHGMFRKSGNSYPTGRATNSIALADFNHDGNLDMVVTNGGSGNIMVFPGHGDGTFGKSSSYKVTEPWVVATADLNGDHYPDLVVAQASYGGLAVLLNNGAGGFGQAAYYIQGVGVCPGVAIADLNHDGYPDLVIADSQTTKVYVLLGKGSGVFSDGTAYSSGGEWGGGTSAIVIADFNRDGNLDVAAVNSSEDSALLYGNGDGTFQPAIPIDTNFDRGGGGQSLVTADFNHDGAPDLAILVQDYGRVAVLLNGK